MDYRKQKPSRINNTAGNTPVGSTYPSSNANNNNNNANNNQTYSYYSNQQQHINSSYSGVQQVDNKIMLNQNNLVNPNYTQHQQHQNTAHSQSFKSNNNQQMNSSTVYDFQNLSLQSDNSCYSNQPYDKINNDYYKKDNTHINSSVMSPVKNSYNSDTTSMVNHHQQQQQQQQQLNQNYASPIVGSVGSGYNNPNVQYQSNVPYQSNIPYQSNVGATITQNVPYQSNVGANVTQNVPYQSNVGANVTPNVPYQSNVGANITPNVPLIPQQQMFKNPNQYPLINNNQTQQSSSQSSSTTGFNDNMPNPIIEQRQIDEKYKGATISYRQVAELPPSSQTDFYFNDEGISSPRYIQSTYYALPSTSKMAKNTKIPLGIIAQPFASIPSKDTPLMSSFQADVDGPLRCEQCRSYVNVQSIFIDGGKTLVCNLCGHKTNVVDSYFCYLDNSGARLDRFSRAELFQGSYELSTNKLYCRNNTLPKPPIYIFMFNVSRNSITNGMISVVADILSSIIPKHLPRDTHYMDQSQSTNNNTPIQQHNGVGAGVGGSNANNNGVDPSKSLLVRVAFMAYDKRVYFFNVREHSHNNKQQVQICIDINDPYIPSYKGFVVDPLDCASQIQSLLQDIPKIFSNSTVVDTLLGPVIESAVSMLKSNNDCGRLFIFHSMLPNLSAPGKLENRDNSPLFCTENELSLLKPNGSYYSKLAEECVSNGVSVNLFLTTAGYVDIATLGNLCESTGGRIFYYPFFDTKRSGQQLAYDVQSFLSRPCGHDAYMKLRVSNGLRVSSIYGCFSFASATDIQVAYIDSDTTIAFELEHDEDLKAGAIVSVQLAILYTASSGQRRLRIHNIYLSHSNEYTDIYRAINCEASVCLLMKKYCVEMLKQNSITFVGDKLSEYTYQPLLAYIKNCKQSQSHFQQLVLPESLKLYPLYVNSLIKSDAFLTRRELGQDGRSMAILRLKFASIVDMLLELYPTIYNIFDPINNATIEELTHKTSSLSELGIQNYRCSYEKLGNDQVYLMVLPHILFLWVGNAINQESFRCLFGVNSIDQIDGVVMETLPAFDNIISNSTRLLINLVRKYHHPNGFIPITVVKQGGISENTFRHFMAESKSSKPKSFTYMEFLCFIHKSINEHL